MSDLAWAVMMLGMIIITLVLIGGVMGFLRWLVSRIVTGIFWSLRALAWAIRSGAGWVAWALQVAAAYAAAQIWRLCGAGLRGLAAMTRKGLSSVMGSISEGWRQRPREGTREEPSGDARDDAEDGQQAEQDAAASVYAAAIELMGLTGVEPLTNALLKQRYGELIRIVHPDKGFPNRVFAQQINAAVMTIKKAHGWR